ncbi:MAG: hypothetical protein LAT57_07190 [Balneolales bacterium]|nr:hypothetical protein [Balneolales bacterium]
MKVLVTDACIFIDLIECAVHEPFFELPYKFVTTDYVWDELSQEHKLLLQPNVDVQKLSIHVADESFLVQTSEKNLSRSLSIADRSVWHLTKTIGDILITSDGALRRMAQKHQLETHGLLWIFEQLVQHSLISSGLALDVLELLFQQNSYYKMNPKLMAAWEKLKAHWED